MICQRDVSADPPGFYCPDCRHTNLVHPGVMNPGIRSCVICELLALVATVHDNSTDHEDSSTGEETK